MRLIKRVFGRHVRYDIILWKCKGPFGENNWYRKIVFGKHHGIGVVKHYFLPRFYWGIRKNHIVFDS